jgi:NADH-quinone oxidoreductase subunit M
MEFTGPLLSVLVWLPILGGALVVALGEQKASQARLLALAVSALTFFLSISLFTAFDRSTAAMQFVEHKVWIDSFSIYYYLGVDGFSVPLILLTTFFGVLVVIAGWESIRTRVHQYMASLLVMEGLMIGVFSALDGFLFYVFF